jgi:Na+/H+ antiporter NhaC
LTDPDRDRPALAEPDPPTPEPGRGFRALARLGPLIVLLAAAAYILTFAPTDPEAAGGHYGVSSVLPAAVTLLLVFLTRDVVASLFLGIAVGGIVIRDPNIIDQFLIPSIGSESFALILLVYLWGLGGLIGIWTRTGGALHFAEWAGRRMVRGPRTAKLFAWIVGVIFHQGGTISTVLAGTTVRPVTDRERVSHEELTYVIDSTASPIATVIPLNAWPLYVASLVVGTTPLFLTEEAAVSFFFRSVAFNFYGMFAVLMTLLFALEVLPYEGRRMRAARLRARATGALDREGAEPITSKELTEMRVPEGYRTGLEDFLVPMGVLLATALTGVVGPLWRGLQAGSMEVFLSAINVPIAEAFGLGLLSAMVLALVKGMQLRQVINGFVDGCRGVTIGAIVLALAVTLGQVSRTLGTAGFIVDASQGLVNPVLLPALLLGICMVVAFSIGSSWGTYAVVFPLAMPLAFAVNPDPTYVALAFGAVLGGGVFGDQCSPISDTTILSSLACGGDIMDHVTTQLPLAMIAAALAAVAATGVALTLG